MPRKKRGQKQKKDLPEAAKVSELLANWVRTSTTGETAAITGGAVGAVGAVLIAPVALSAIGFTSAGIAANSYAASMMSAAATANGGGVAAGSLVAILQSAGVSGFTEIANMFLASIGGALGTCVGAAVGWLSNIFQKRNEQKKREEAMAAFLFGIAAGALFMSVVPKLRPAGRIRPTSTFGPAP